MQVVDRMNDKLYLVRFTEKAVYVSLINEEYDEAYDEIMYVCYLDDHNPVAGFLKKDVLMDEVERISDRLSYLFTKDTEAIEKYLQSTEEKTVFFLY